MKIVFVNRYFYPDHSATSQLLSQLAFHLAAHGMDIEVVTSRQRYDEPNAILPVQEEIRGVRVHRAWSTRLGRARLSGRALDYATFYLGAGWTLFRRLSRHDVLVAKTDPPLMSVVAGLVAMLTGAKLVNWLQDLFPEVASASGLRAFDGTLGRLIRGLRNHSLRQATMNVAIGQRMADLLRTGIGIPAERVTVIHNWADGDAIRPGEIATNPLRRQWGLANKFVVGYSGNMGRVHEFGAILDAATQLRNEHDIVFLFIGSGQQRDFIKQSARERGLGNVFFKPYQDEASLSKSLAAPDVHLISLKPKLEGLVVPSKFYGIAAAGRPMLFVGDQTGEAASMIASADCGHSFSTSDGAGLAQAILQLRDDANERQRLGRNARNAFDQYYRRDLALDQWQTLLAGALHR